MSPNESGIPNPEIADLKLSFQEQKIKLLEAFKRPENLEQVFCNLYRAFKEDWVFYDAFCEEDILLNLTGSINIKKTFDHTGEFDFSCWLNNHYAIKQLTEQPKEKILDMKIRLERIHIPRLKAGGSAGMETLLIDDILKNIDSYTDITNQISWTAGRIIIKPTHPLGNKWFKSEFSTRKGKGNFTFDVDYNGICNSMSFGLEEI